MRCDGVVGRVGLLVVATMGTLAVSCSSGEPTTPPAARAPSDPDDVFCDPLDALADDTTDAVAPAEPLTQWVDPRIGTGGSGFAVGTTYPGPQVPFGMAKPGPDTSRRGRSETFAHCSGYSYDDDTIEAFGQARLHGAGIADYGGVALMPVNAMTPAMAGPRKHGASFSHDKEMSSPGAYAVTLGSGIEVELSATAHVGAHRFTFPAGSSPTVLLDVGHTLAEGTTIKDGTLTIDPAAREVRGMSHVLGGYSERYGGVKIYFVARFEQAFASHATYAGGAITEGSSAAQGIDAGAVLRFDAASASRVVAHVGLSFVDEAHAKQNLDAELLPFDRTRDEARAIWERRLGIVRASTRTDRDRRIFYTALYHAQLMPTLASDVSGDYRGIDGNVHQLVGGGGTPSSPPARYFTDFSLWDTYRTLHPLVTLLYPDDARDFAKSLTAMGREAGFVPRWPLGTGETGGMVGDGGAIVLADTFVRGVRDWDAAAALDVLVRQADTKLERGGRDEVEEYTKLGYVPVETGNNSAGKTLEYAHADHAVGELAKALGREGDAARFFERGKSWKNLFDAKTKFFLGRRRDGTFGEANLTATSEDFSEGTPWHYRFMVPHDAPGLAEHMGRETLLAGAEQLFTRAACTTSAAPSFLPNPYYWASNEPVLFSSWLFAAVGDPARTARWSRWTLLTHWSDTPAGLPGNDDGGTMSAFYVFGALGFYPIAGTDRFVIGSPFLPRVTLALRDGLVTIDAPNASRKRRFHSREPSKNGSGDSAVTRNATAFTSPTITRAELAGATLTFELSETPPSR